MTSTEEASGPRINFKNILRTFAWKETDLLFVGKTKQIQKSTHPTA
jgi:hypothetical protein